MSCKIHKINLNPYLALIIFLGSFLFFVPKFSLANFPEETFLSDTIIAQDTIWNGTKIIDGAKITVNSGVTLTLEPGTMIVGKNGASIYIKGRFIAIGEKDKKIRFTSDKNRKQNFTLTYYLSSIAGSEVELRNFILEDGGGNQDIASFPALTIKGKGAISDCLIRRNRTTAVRFWNNLANSSIENCEIYENENFALENKGAATVNAKNNWWGSEKGPSLTSSPPQSFIWGNIAFSPWQEKGPIPLIIIPGFGASFSLKLFNNEAEDAWWINPLGTSAYQYFIKALSLSGYYYNKDYFWAFYDWRKSNNQSSIVYLEKIINEVKEKTGHNTVNLVAHSMGGLLARSYLQSDHFKDDVDRLVTAGTPHLGSSETYSIWEGGELLGNKKMLLPYLWYLEALNNHLSSRETLRNEFPSLAEMIPTYDFLIDKENGGVISNQTQIIRNNFLEKLNNNLSSLQRKIFLGTVSGSGEETLEKIPVRKCNGICSLYEDGIPDPINPVADSLRGDGTVTKESAELGGLLTNNSISLESNHGDLFQKGQKSLFDELNIHTPSPFLFKTLGHFMLTALGPIDVKIEDQSGKIVQNDQNQIDGDKLQETTIEGKKLFYASLPIDLSNGEEKTYKISLSGREPGLAKLAFWHLGEEETFNKIEKEISTEENSKATFVVSLSKNANGFPQVDVIKTDSLALLKTSVPILNGEYLNWQYLLPEATIWTESNDEIIENSRISFSMDQKGINGNVDLSSYPLGNHTIKVQGNWSKNSFPQSATKEISFTTSTSFKSISTLIDRFYLEEKINNWSIRSNLINLSSLAYQALSEGNLNEVQNKIGEIKKIIKEEKNIFKEEKDQEIMINSIAYLENNPR